jgi:hypothetical protein
MRHRPAIDIFMDTFGLTDQCLFNFKSIFQESLSPVEGVAVLGHGFEIKLRLAQGGLLRVVIAKGAVPYMPRKR